MKANKYCYEHDEQEIKQQIPPLPKSKKHNIGFPFYFVCQP